MDKNINLETIQDSLKRIESKINEQAEAQISSDIFKKVVFNDPATIVYWSDGSKTVVKSCEKDPYIPETGIALCFMKKMLGDDFHKVLKNFKPQVSKDELYNIITDSMAPTKKEVAPEPAEEISLPPEIMAEAEKYEGDVLFETFDIPEEEHIKETPLPVVEKVAQPPVQNKENPIKSEYEKKIEEINDSYKEFTNQTDDYSSLTPIED